MVGNAWYFKNAYNIFYYENHAVYCNGTTGPKNTFNICVPAMYYPLHLTPCIISTLYLSCIFICLPVCLYINMHVYHIYIYIYIAPYRSISLSLLISRHGRTESGICRGWWVHAKYQKVGKSEATWTHIGITIHNCYIALHIGPINIKITHRWLTMTMGTTCFELLRGINDKIYDAWGF